MFSRVLRPFDLSVVYLTTDAMPSEGHELFALIARIVTTALSSSLNTPTAQNPVGSNSEARKDGMALIPLETRPHRRLKFIKSESEPNLNADGNWRDNQGGNAYRAVRRSGLAPFHNSLSADRIQARSDVVGNVLARRSRRTAMARSPTARR